MKCFSYRTLHAVVTSLVGPAFLSDMEGRFFYILLFEMANIFVIKYF